ncbi:hypothetical protein YPPY89_0605, partial [Yersinia pestis PY-89]
MVSRSDWQG